MNRRLWAGAPVVLVLGCSALSSSITVDVEVTGEGVDQAIIEFRDTDELVDLPWSTTVTVEDDAGTDTFTVLATNPTEAGVLRCDADWAQAASDSTWSRTAGYQVSCGARVSFRDGGTVMLDPTGRRISFEERDAELASEAAELAAEQARQARVDAARSNALAELESARVGDWTVVASGVLIDAEDYIEDLSSGDIQGRGVALIAEVTATYEGGGTGDPGDLSFELIGGDELERFKTFEASCGVIPQPVYEVEPAAPGESVVFNVCWQIDEEETTDAFVEVRQLGVGADATRAQLLLPRAEGLRGGLATAESGEVQVGDDWRIEVLEVRIDDVEGLREREPDTPEPRAGRAYLWLQARVTNTGTYESWPADSWTKWFVAAPDGVTRYDDGAGDRCPRYESALSDRDIGDPMIAPGDSLELEHCWEIAAEHVDGVALLVSTTGDVALIDLEP